jgi:hypothetical protein
MTNDPVIYITLKEICQKEKLDTRLARMILREAAKDTKKYPALSKPRKARTPWAWPKGSKGVEEAIVALAILVKK